MLVKVIASIQIRPDCEAAFLDAARAVVAASRREPGVVSFELWQQEGRDGIFTFTELYTGEAAMMDHAASDHVEAFGRVARSLAAGPPSIAIYREARLMLPDVVVEQDGSEALTNLGVTPAASSPPSTGHHESVS